VFWRLAAREIDPTISAKSTPPTDDLDGYRDRRAEALLAACPVEEAIVDHH
jgi:hypothetical protein